MADKTINQLEQATGLTDSSLFVIEQNSTAKQANWGMMKNYISPGVAVLYSTSATYNVGEYVIYNGSLYRCNTAITTGEAWTASHWTAAVLGDDVVELKSAITNLGVEIVWEQGRLTTTGANIDSTYAVRSKNYIPVSEDDVFYLDIPLSGQIEAAFYNSSKVFQSRQTGIRSNITIPSNASYMRIYFYYNTTTNITVSEVRKLHIYKLFANDGNAIHSLTGNFSISEWASDTYYVVGKIVKNAGVYYACKTEHTSGAAFDSSKFSRIILCNRTEVMKRRLIIDYVKNGYDATKAPGTVFYNTTLHVLYFVYKYSPSFYGEVIPWYEGTIYSLDGKDYIYDYDNCSLIPKDTEYQVGFNVSPEISMSGHAIGSSGGVIVSPNYNITQPLEMCPGDEIVLTGTVGTTVAAIAETDVIGSYYKPVILGTGDSGDYKYTATNHVYVAASCYTNAKYSFLYTRKRVNHKIVPEWEMQGFFSQYGSIRYSSSVPSYYISKPVKMYAGETVNISCYAIANDPVLLEYQDRWNTYWANVLGNANILILPNETGYRTYQRVIPKTSYYVFSCVIDSNPLPQFSVTRSPSLESEVEASEAAEAWQYGTAKHNYVDTFDFVPDLTKKRTNAILTYSADDKKDSNYIVNAVAYPNGEIIACRAGGQVVRITNDGTETVLLTINNAQDWRGVFMDSNLNVYVSPHSSTFSPGVAAIDRGLYKLEYGSNSFEKVISLCRSTTEITKWAANTSYNVGDIVFRDNQSDMYKCKTAHTSSSTFDITYWDSFPAWESSTQYSVGDIVIWHSCYFRCKTAHTSSSIFNRTYWDAATEWMLNDDTIWTMCEDSDGYIYAGVYSHSVRANPAVYQFNGSTWIYIYNFIMNGCLPSSKYGSNTVKHVHCVNYNPYDGKLYAAVGEVNTIVKSDNKAASWTDMEVPCYYGQPTYILGSPDGLVIGSDGHYSCGVSKLMTDGKTMKLCGRTAPGFIFNIRRSDLTGWLYAWTRIDNIVANEDECPPYEAIDDIDAYNDWVANAPASTLRFWNPYHEWAEKYYPEDARRPQNAVIMVSKDEGDTWEVFNKVKVSQNKASICGYITVGYFRDGECLAGLLRPINGTESGISFVQPVIISEGKKKHTADGYDLSGEIFIKTNTSNIVGY